MQRECNVVAFGELTLSTRLNKNEMDTSKSKILMSSKRTMLRIEEDETLNY